MTLGIFWLLWATHSFHKDQNLSLFDQKAWPYCQTRLCTMDQWVLITPKYLRISP